MIRVLVTGSDGFIGSNLVKKLNKLNYDIVCVDKNPKHEDTLRLDVSTEKFNEHFTNNIFDYVFHFGSPCSIIQFKDNPTYYENNTYEGFRNIIKLVKKSGAKLIYPSTGNVYGSINKPHCETDQLKPINIYGMCKLWSEYLVTTNKVNSIGLRIYCGYGNGEEAKGSLASVLCKFMKNMRMGISPIIWGNGFQTRDFIHVDDIVKGIIKSMSLKDSHIINLASGTSINYNNLVKLINKTIGTDIIPKYAKKPDNYVVLTIANIDLMKKLLKFKAISLEKGIQKFYEYLLKS